MFQKKLIHQTKSGHLRPAKNKIYQYNAKFVFLEKNQKTQTLKIKKKMM